MAQASPWIPGNADPEVGIAQVATSRRVPARWLPNHSATRAGGLFGNDLYWPAVHRESMLTTVIGSEWLLHRLFHFA